MRNSCRVHLDRPTIPRRSLCLATVAACSLLAAAAGALPDARHAGARTAREAAADREGIAGREQTVRGRATCEVRGRSAAVDLVEVNPPDGPPIRLALTGAPATLQLAPPEDGRAMHAIAVSGALGFEGRTPGEWVHLTTTRPLSLAGGVVRLGRGLRLGEVRGAPGPAAQVTVDLDRALRFPGLLVPCGALGLDQPATAEGVDTSHDEPTDGSFWVARGRTLALHGRPGGGPAVNVEVEYPPALVMGRVRSQGRSFLLQSWVPEAPVVVSGWVDEEQVEGFLPWTRAFSPPPLERPAVEPVPAPARGEYQGPAAIAPGTAVYALPEGRGPWAVVREPAGATALTVRWRPDQRWVQIVAAPGVSGLAGHAWVDRRAVRLPLPSGTYRVTGAPVASRLGHTATRLRDGRVLIAGGWGPTADDPDRRVPLASAELYQGEPGEERFVATGALLTGRAGHTATLLPDGRVLLVGGEWNPPGDGGIALDQAELYLPDSGSFVSTGSLRRARSGHTATLLPDGTVLIVGGDDGHGRALDSAELWDPHGGVFHPAGRLGIRRYDHAATLLPSGKVMITGGRHKNYGLRDFWTTFPIDAVELYDPLRRAFEAGGELPAGGRTRHSATLLSGGRVLLAGGARQTDLDLAGIARSALLYLPDDGHWTRAGDSGAREEEARGEHSATALADGRVLVVSGPFTLLYDADARRWDSLPGPTFERFGHTATALADGRVVVVGGDAGEGRATPMQPGAELFLPPPRR